MIAEGTDLSSPTLVKLSQKIAERGMVALQLQNEYEEGAVLI